MPPRFGPITEKQANVLTALGIDCRYLHNGTADTLLKYLFRGSFGSENPVLDERLLQIYKQKQEERVGQYVEIQGSGNRALRVLPTRGEIVRLHPKHTDRDIGLRGAKRAVSNWLDDANWVALLLLPNKNLKNGVGIAGLVPAERPQSKVSNKKRRKR